MEDRKVMSLLLVEDNPADAELLCEGIAEAGMAVNLQTVTTGGEALAYLRPDRDSESTPVPALILLDLNLPGIDGLEVLRTIKRDIPLKRIPVLMLSSSSAERDILASYDLGASAYLVKPSGLKQLRDLTAALNDFWLTTCTLPPARLQ